MGRAGEGREQQVVGILDRMLLEDESSAPGGEVMVVVALWGALKPGELGRRSQPERRLSATSQCWLAADPGNGGTERKGGEEREVEDGPNGCGMGRKRLTW